MAYSEVVVAFLDCPQAYPARVRRRGGDHHGDPVRGRRTAPRAAGVGAGVGVVPLDLGRRGLWLTLPPPALTVVQNWLQGSVLHTRRTQAITEAGGIILLVTGAFLAGGVIGGDLTAPYVALAAMTAGGTGAHSGARPPQPRWPGMNIGLIVYSQTGNTLSVAERLREALARAGHTVTVERVEAEGEAKPGQRVNLKTAPDPRKYDAVLFGSPVHAFSLAPAMRADLAQVPALGGKRVAGFVTQGLPFTWMGGNRALRQLRRACEAKGATVRGSRVVNWSRKDREGQIAGLVDRLSRCLQP